MQLAQQIMYEQQLRQQQLQYEQVPKHQLEQQLLYEQQLEQQLLYEQQLRQQMQCEAAAKQLQYEHHFRLQQQSLNTSPQQMLLNPPPGVVPPGYNPPVSFAGEHHGSNFVHSVHSHQTASAPSVEYFTHRRASEGQSVIGSVFVPSHSKESAMESFVDSGGKKCDVISEEHSPLVSSAEGQFKIPLPPDHHPHEQVQYFDLYQSKLE